MASTAPVVLRCGTIVAHINDPRALQDAAAALAACSCATRPTSVAIAASEEALILALAMGFAGSSGSVATQLRDAGLPVLARRVRNAARSRGADAHPDTMLAEDWARELGRRATHNSGARGMFSDTPQTPLLPEAWSPSCLMDGRKLRQRSCASRGELIAPSSEVVKPLVAAALPLSGDEWRCVVQRIESLEKAGRPGP